MFYINYNHFVPPSNSSKNVFSDKFIIDLTSNEIEMYKVDTTDIVKVLINDKNKFRTFLVEKFYSFYRNKYKKEFSGSMSLSVVIKN